MIACVRVLYQDMGEYDPVRPGILDVGMANVTAMPVAFNKDLARALGGRQAGDSVMFLLCHPDDWSQDQLVWHALVRPARSLLALRDIPEEYVSGELILPLYGPISSTLVFLSAPGHACCRLYAPAHLADELAHVNVFLRCGTDWDRRAEDGILREYLSRFAPGGMDAQDGLEQLRQLLPGV